MCCRNICIAVVAGMYSSSGCLNLYFIGMNDNEPAISYTPGERTEIMLKVIYFFSKLMTGGALVLLLIKSTAKHLQFLMDCTVVCYVHMLNGCYYI